jgi:hypothetical protein
MGDIEKQIMADWTNDKSLTPAKQSASEYQTFLNAILKDKIPYDSATVMRDLKEIEKRMQTLKPGWNLENDLRKEDQEDNINFEAVIEIIEGWNATRRKNRGFK